MSRAVNWCFTLNNWTQGEFDLIAQLGQSDHVEYLVVGRETGESGTPHLQGFVRFKSRQRLSAVRTMVSTRGHFEVAKGTPHQAAQYCKKENDFEEYGTPPTVTQGKRNDWERLRQHVDELGERPERRSLFVLFPSLMARYESAVWEYIDAVRPLPVLQQGEPRDWQQDLEQRLVGDADDRTIEFVVDPIGNSGKTWFCRYMLTKYPDKTQYLRIGKRDDMCFMIDPSKKIFMIDVPRQQMEYLQYSVLEMIKDRLVISPKYHSTMKVIPTNTHVVVFCNEYPNHNALSADRVSVTQLNYVTVRG